MVHLPEMSLGGGDLLTLFFVAGGEGKVNVLLGTENPNDNSQPLLFGEPVADPVEVVQHVAAKLLMNAD